MADPSDPNRAVPAWAAGVVAGAATDVGRLRVVNEDGYLAVSPAFVVVDGMGGHAAGRAATQAALGVLYSLAGRRVTRVEEVLRAVAAAQEAIVDIPSHAAFLPGATVAGAVLADLEEPPAGQSAPDGRTHLPEPVAAGSPAGAGTRLTWLVFNIGDARTYLLRDGVLSQLTRDHSQVQDLIDSGYLTPEDARVDPRRNIVTRALGGGIADSAVPDLCTVPVEAGDRVLVCSDGLSDELDDDSLAVVLTAGFPPQRTADLLVAASLEEGGHDNTTAVVVDIVDVADGGRARGAAGAAGATGAAAAGS
ncbi:serine/threonine-protein phosphatase [Actinomyces sp. 2119]|uniref:PP2C family protein-serine/threonine phosphatase n=1 Tax=Actinomyces sp. 2119 TaxID=2321393 RepID=UPI000E6CB31B|nr:protein phosphatase 2C domain-containing protein [Actinomyces sp. 2119]RJF40499.1 serine/threonine-protein phosphatase [Actinomyces sp. 2119]RJF41840.1 serine/threonine-protein phosphatase [Actinomyces sp. 2119]